MLSILYSSIFIIIASMVQGSIGFGFALIAVPLLSLLLPLDTIVPVVVISSLIINIIIVLNSTQYLKINQINIMIIFGILGIPLGIYGLKNINPEILKRLIGIIITVTSIIIFKGIKIKFKNIKLSYGIAGFISGVLNGSLSMSGPPIVLFFSNEGFDKNELRANIALYGIITNIITTILFYFSGLLNEDIIGILSFNIFALFLGSFAGVYFSSKIKDKHFKSIVLILLMVVGFFTVIKSF